MAIQLRSGRITATVAAVTLLAAGCASAQAAQPPGAVQQPVGVSRGVAATEPTADAGPYGAGDTSFGLNVLHAWCQSEPTSNLVLSPASLATGLGMAYLGSRGSTAQAMASVLHLPGAGSAAGPGTDPAADQALLAGLQARTAALSALNGPGVKLAASNQVWADPSLPTQRGYLNALATAYRAGVNRVPVRTDPAQAAQQINRAISAATDGQIPKLLSPAMLHDLGWVLTSALYLNAVWAKPFQASETTPGQFSTAAGATVTANFMNGTDFRVGTAGGWTGVSLPYRGGKVAMVALLPPGSAPSSCAVPSVTALNAITAASTQGSVVLPKVNLRSDTSMKDLLSGLGMGIAFGGGANFSGLSSQACCIGVVQQAATLRVDEKGTVAAAATAVGIVSTAMPAPVGPKIVFNRPYLLLVTSVATGEPLFLVRVTNPAAS
jgi:serine protease inhibitor